MRNPTVEVASDRRLVLTDAAAPEPGPGQALIEVAACGICGSDLHFRDVPELFPAGTVPGHEIAGRIAATGEGVSDWSVGQRVTVLPFAQCGACELCRAGHEQVCPHAVVNGVGLGTGRPGGYARSMVVDERMLFALPDGVDDHTGTLVEPLAVAVRAVNAVSATRADPVHVLGAGPIGLLTALVLRERGYERSLVVSRNPRRAAFAEQLGLHVVNSEQLRDGAAPASVVDCAGSPSSAQLAVELLRPLGQLLLVGLSLAPLDLSAPPIVIKELDIRGVITYRRGEFQEAIDLLASGRIPGRRLITDVVGLDRAEAAFQALTAPGTEQIKVILTPEQA